MNHHRRRDRGYHLDQVGQNEDPDNCETVMQDWTLKGPREIIQPDIGLQVRRVPIEEGMVDRAYRRVVGKGQDQTQTGQQELIDRPVIANRAKGDVFHLAGRPVLRRTDK